MPNPTNLQYISAVAAENPNSLSLHPGSGGRIIYCIAGGTLLIGDVTYWTTTTEQVNTSASQANAAFFAGVVVGGGSWPNSNSAAYANTIDVADCDPSTSPIGATAAVVNQVVAIQIDGIAWVVAGAAVATSGVRLMFDTGTAGRVIGGSTTGQVVGISVEAAAGAASIFRMHIRNK